MYRQSVPNEQRLTAMLRDMQDQITKLNQGQAFAGRVSFGGEIQLGKIVVTTSGDTVTFTNQSDGKTAVITLT